MTNGDASTLYTGADPHAVHGLVTQERIQIRMISAYSSEIRSKKYLKIYLIFRKSKF